MRLALEDVVPAQREPDDSAHLLFDVALVAQFGHCHARERGIDSLLRQGHKLLRVVFIVLGQSEKKFGLDGRALHLDFLCVQCASEEVLREWHIGGVAGNLSRMH